MELLKLELIMEQQENILSFLDLLDLNEDIIDERLKSIASRSSYTNKHLQNVLLLLQYKSLINTKEDSDCENDDEYDLAVKLMRNVNTENVDCICKIINTVLCLNKSSIVNKSEHLIQQILMNIVLSTDEYDSLTKEGSSQKIMNLKLCGSILDAIISTNNKLILRFLETPLEVILDSGDEQLKYYFLTNTVPKLVRGVIVFNILDRIWEHLKQSNDEPGTKALMILSCLSDYFLPMPDDNGIVYYESEIVFLDKFWNIILNGILLNDTATRKFAIYLCKRAIDSIISSKKDVTILIGAETIFSWTKNDTIQLKNMWDNYFILIDSLEEKQSNIVLPSLKLFETINIEECWLNAAYNIGLSHDNTQVRLKCIEYKLKTKIKNLSEAVTLLEAFNNINIYDVTTNYKYLKSGLCDVLKHPTSFKAIFNTILSINWSPIPFYHITDVLARSGITHSYDIYNTFIDILRLPCNSVVIRKAVRINLVTFAKNYCENMNWHDTVNIFSIIQLDAQKFPIAMELDKTDEEKYNCFRTLSTNTTSIDLILKYLSNNKDDMCFFVDIINEKLTKISNICTRPYADKNECLKDVIFLIHLLGKTGGSSYLEKVIYGTVARHNSVFIQYFISLFSSENNLNIYDAAALLVQHDYRFEDATIQDFLLKWYKTTILFMKDNPILGKAVFSLFTLKLLHGNSIFVNNYKHKMLNLKQFLDIITKYQFTDTTESVGRLRNVLYEKTCEVISDFIKDEEDYSTCMKELIYYIENVLECGGYGCLQWILKIVNKIIKPLVDKKDFDMVKFINRVWYEIEELKSSNQYSLCIEEFVCLITQDAILARAMYNNIVILHSKKIVENGWAKINPLYYLIRKINKKSVQDYGHIVYILCEVLLYCPVIRKDQRITDNLCLQILQKEEYGIDKSSLDIHFNYEIQYLAAETLCQIKDSDTLTIIAKFITDKIDATFRNKQRYHGNSQQHKTLLASLQHILIVLLKCPQNLDWLLNWCLDLLVKLPHQPSVRICMEWFVALYLYIQKTEVNEEILQLLKIKNVPLASQFFIVYWLLKHKISNQTYSEGEYNCVLDFLLSHTMGQLFNVRLHAQYLCTVLHKMALKSTKFDYTIGVIEKTFQDNSNDKNYIKLKNDYFANIFDIVANANPYFIYYLLPKYCELDNNESIDFNFVRNLLKNSDCVVGEVEWFRSEWKLLQREDEEFIGGDNGEGIDSLTLEDGEGTGTIQKKYVPWKNMSDINVYDAEIKSEIQGDLLLVASLIDKLPNLGGMARTSEVFGVKTYVIGSLRHLQDKQFQGLSVSAERWVNIEEVRPGHSLKKYLLKKKADGYSVVAAEQTSTSTKLQSFKFPRKTILLLGHEKEGVPCDLLPMMDHCVEIPQQGYVRSLNVHVTAAIFVWEYVKQNIL